MLIEKLRRDLNVIVINDPCCEKSATHIYAINGEIKLQFAYQPPRETYRYLLDHGWINDDGTFIYRPRT